ncbi:MULTISPECIES: hypothetical protein [unclassified Kitasatospora]|uniref:hypothetical protein n=1 Tax=unclassified Kitasatospora TaxID=2633591 RepID=UPI002475EB96|nr:MULTISPECIES: hypothetical protein [unclassified Kitasatospora]MDH6123857.1 hypothetical protein [Kitasatospora sp. GP82]MDH6576044.1 hypothetical protein [Kitasatospora sp. MAP5-34]
MALNPNWPVLDYAWGPVWNASGGSAPGWAYTALTGRTMGKVGVGRGRQYETDQVQAGTMSARFANNDGQLDPMNAASPWNGRIKPYTPLRVRVQYPPTQNMLTQGAATGGDVAATLGTMNSQNPSLWISSSTDSNNGSVVASGSAFQGSNVLQFNIPANTSASPVYNARIFYALNGSVVPGQTYTFQARVRNVTASASLTVAPFFEWYGWNGGSAGNLTGTYVVGSNSTLAGSTSAAWTQVTFTATAPTSGGVYGIVAGVALTATSPASAVSLQADALQLEKGSTATAFTVPGITYPLYSGFVERWPSKWDFGGTYGVVDPTVVDSFALLSQRQLRDPLTQEIYSHTPNFIYTLGDPQGTSYFADATGNYGPASIGVSAYGAGSVTAGNKIQSSSAGGTFMSTNTVVTVANANPGTNYIGAASFVSLSAGGVKGPKDPAAWTRIIAFRYTGPVPSTGNAVLWTAFGPQGGGGGSRIEIGINSSSQLYATVQGPTGAQVSGHNGHVNVCDGNWHLGIISYSGTTGFGVACDGGLIDYWSGYSASTNPTGLISDSVGGWVDPSTGNGTAFNYQGDIAYAAEFSGFFFSNDVTNLYSAWKSQAQGDSTDQRYARILRWAGYTGASDIGTGQTTSMGPASVAGQDALSALASVVETENGLHYINSAGTIVFRGRGTRYNNTSPVYTFGENTGAGEWPYDEVELDFDSTHLANQVTVTQPANSTQANGQNFTAADTTSQNDYFPRTMSRTVNSTSDAECQDAANYFLSRYKNPLTRVQSIKLHPSANPALWPVCLSLELNMRVRIMRRPFGAPPIQVDCFVEHIQWDLDDQNEAFVTLQCSPVDPTPYGLFGAFRTTIYGSTTQPIGTSGFPVGPMNGDNSQALAAIVGHGSQITIEPGTSNAETFTVDYVTATTPGSWTYGNIVMTTASTKAHPAGAVVCEALPSGVTDPTKYDTSDKFDSAAFSY